LCGKENVEYFCRTNKKKFTLHNLHLFEKSKAIAPATPVKKEKKEQSSLSSTKTKAKGLSQNERDLLEYLKDDPSMKQIVLQKILDKQGNSDDDETVSSAASSPPKPEDFQDSQDPYELQQRRQELVSSQNAKSKITPCKSQLALGKSKG